MRRNPEALVIQVNHRALWDRVYRVVRGEVSDPGRATEVTDTLMGMFDEELCTQREVIQGQAKEIERLAGRPEYAGGLRAE